MTAPRYTADSITEEALTELYDNANRAWRRGDRWKKRAETAEAAIVRLRLMHKPRTERPGSACVQCGIVWPCPSFRALREPEETSTT